MTKVKPNTKADTRQRKQAESKKFKPRPGHGPVAPKPLMTTYLPAYTQKPRTLEKLNNRKYHSSTYFFPSPSNPIESTTSPDHPACMRGNRNGITDRLTPDEVYQSSSTPNHLTPPNSLSSPFSSFGSAHFNIHRDLCNDNLWYDNCPSENTCHKYHIRHKGQSLRLFDTHANLYRVSQKKGHNKAELFHLPLNTELHIMDILCDPETWHNPITTVQPNIQIHRAIGLHPKYKLKLECLTDLQQALSKLLKLYNFQACGLVGAETLGNEPYGLATLNSTLDTFRRQPKPVIIHSRLSDQYCVAAVNNRPEIQFLPIIWHGINIGEQRLCSQKDFLDQHYNHFFSINNLEAESTRVSLLLDKILEQPNRVERLLTESDCPNNPPRKSRIATATPLNVISATIAIHKVLKQKPGYSHHTLADTNDLLFQNACNAFKIDLSKKPENIQEYTFKAHAIMAPLLEKWKGQFHYINPKAIQFASTTSVTTATQTSQDCEPTLME
jgi:Tat protein secretion system quality control protein TatD with DNase activity